MKTLQRKMHYQSKYRKEIQQKRSTLHLRRLLTAKFELDWGQEGPDLTLMKIPFLQGYPNPQTRLWISRPKNLIEISDK